MSEVIIKNENGEVVERYKKERGRPPKNANKDADGNFIIIIQSGHKDAEDHED